MGIEVFNQLMLTEDGLTVAEQQFRDTHTRICYNAQKSAEHWVEMASGEVKIKRDKETDEKIKAFYKDIHGLTEWTDGEYSVIMPKTAAAIIKEGKEMHHCVGGYCGIVAKRESVILFIRRNANKRAAFVTMEIHPYLDRIEIVQVRAKRNAEPSAEVIAFLEKYKKWFNTRALPEKAKSAA